MWDDSFFIILFTIALLIVGSAVSYLVWQSVVFLYNLLVFKRSYGIVITMEGKVTDMDYIPPRTSSHYNGKTVVTTTKPAIHEVEIETSLAKSVVESVELYQRVRIGEKITVKSQERFKMTRLVGKKWKKDGFRLISITSVLGETINFNKEIGN